MNEPIANLNEMQANKEYYYLDRAFIGRGPYFPNEIKLGYSHEFRSDEPVGMRLVVDFAFSDKSHVEEASEIMNGAIKEVADIVEKLRTKRVGVVVSGEPQ